MEELKDLTLRCNTCKNFFTLSSTLEHKKHHRAMRIMRFKEGKGPRNIESLNKRHMMLLQKMLAKFKDSPTDPNLAKRMEKITDAYDTLRFEFTKDDSKLKSMLVLDGMTSMRDGYFEPRDRIEEDQVETQAISDPNYSNFPSCVYGIGQSQAINTDWRDEMQDAVNISLQMPNLLPRSEERGVCYVGMFDGHHGATAAQTCAENMHIITSQQFFEYRNSSLSQQNIVKDNMLSTEIENTEDIAEVKLSDSDISKCMKKSYHSMDGYLAHGINESSRLRWSGCTALTCLVVEENNRRNINDRGDGQSAGSTKQSSQNGSDKVSTKNSKIGKVYVSNTGNVRAVLYHKKKPHQLSVVHTLENAKELERVVDAGGNVNSSERHPRVNGVLDATRSLGNHGDPLLKKCVIPTPHTTAAQLTGESQMLVIATNSIWEVLSPSDVFSVLVHSIPSDASTVLRSGPTPIIPVMHGHLRGGRKGAGDGSEAHQISSTLPSIVETEEEQEIEEVIFVEAQESDSEDEDKTIPNDNITVDSAMEGVGDHSTDSSLVANKTERENSKEQREDLARSVDESASSFSAGDESLMTSGDAAREKERNSRESYARVASVLSDQLVRAAIVAGAVDNVSAVVILFKGMFNP